MRIHPYPFIPEDIIMLTRREMLSRTLKGASLLTFGSVVPQFVANTARAAQEKGKENILVVIELSGGNDGLNTVIPHSDDEYQKLRPTLKFNKTQVVKVTDDIGLHPAMRSFERLLADNRLAVVQGIGYPNPDRSHFESMDIWQSADPSRKTETGWIGRAAANMQETGGNVPIMNIGPTRLPRALTGSQGGAVSINTQQPYKLDLGGGSNEQQKARRTLIDSLAEPEKNEDDSLLQFVVRRQVQTLLTVDKLQEVLRNQQREQPQFSPDGGRRFFGPGSLPQRLNLIAELIRRNFGTRVFYVQKDGFDTHSDQAMMHQNLLQEVADGITQFLDQLKQSGDDQRVRVMTFSEFGRRAGENSSKGTDHGSGSCLFVAGPKMKKGGLIGKHPDLKNLDSGDVRWHTDFRRLYATLLDHWLGCDSKVVLAGEYQHLDELKG
jgi:uncharacterized protein (DUF1501 family)